MEPLLVVAEIIGSSGKNDTTFSFKIVFKCDYDHYSIVAFGKARITL